MDIVLGVSMAPSAVRMVLVEGENADGVTVDQDDFDVSGTSDTAASTTTDQVVSAILGTREGAAEGGYQLRSTGVTWTDRIEPAALRDALAERKIENVVLVSAFLAAAALAQTVGDANNYAHTALLFVEPDTATLAVVDSADGSISEVHRRALPDDDEKAVAELITLVSRADVLDTRPGGVFVVGSGVDIPLIKPALEAATSLAVSACEEPDLALARGAALASANAPLFTSSTAALAYAQDPGTGAVDPYAVSPGYLALADAAAGAELGPDALAYSVVADADADASTGERSDSSADVEEDETLDSGLLDSWAIPVEQSTRKPFFAALSVMTIFVVGVVALVISLAFSIRPSVNHRPSLAQNVVAPTKQAPAPPPKAQVLPAPAPPLAPPAPANAVAPAAPAPGPAPLPVRAPAPAPPPPPAGHPLLPLIIPELLAPRVQGPPIQPGGGIPGGANINNGGGNQVGVGVGGLPGIGVGGGNIGGGNQVNIGGGGLPGVGIPGLGF